MRVEGTTDINKILDGDIDFQADKVIKAIQNKEEIQNKTEDKPSDIIDDMLDVADVKQTKQAIGIEEPVKVQNTVKKFEPLTDEDRDIAVGLALIPKAYREAAFNEQRIKSNLRESYSRSKGIRLTYNFSEYISLCNTIISTIRLGNLPERSYIIGAPNGFGRTSFVTECIITLNKNCYTCAPYISLRELSSVRRHQSRLALKPYSYTEYKKKLSANEETKAKLDREYLEYYQKDKDYALQPRKLNPSEKYPKEFVWDQFSYDEYINAACVFVALTEPADKEVESYELKQLLTIRGMKGLPTIVMTGDSMNAYFTDEKLREQVWDEIITYKRDMGLYDMLLHVSCYSYKTYNIDKAGIKFEDESLGIVRSKRDKNDEHS